MEKFYNWKATWSGDIEISTFKDIFELQSITKFL